MKRLLVRGRRLVRRAGKLPFAFALLTPVPPTLASVDAGMDDLGLWPIISFFVIGAAIVYFYRRFARR